MFLTELCDALDLPKPEPANASTQTNDYVFERRVTQSHRDGSVSHQRIDLYRRDHFVLEAKQSRRADGVKPDATPDLFGAEPPRRDGWPADMADENTLQNLVALNTQRAAEEARGTVHRLRPDYQIPRFGTPKEKAELALEGGGMATPAPAGRSAFPSGDIAQTGDVMAALAAAPGPLDAKTLAAQFKGRKVEESVEEILASLVRTGAVAPAGGGLGSALGR